MRKLAKLLSMLLVAATLLSVCAFSASAAEFKDISRKDEALFEAVQLLNSLGIAKGQSETNYGANKPVTREQMSAFIYRLMKEGRSLEGGENTTQFTDLKDNTFFGMVSWANASGIIKGISATEFNPSGKITLQDCYVMLTRALGYEKDGALNYPMDYIDIAEEIGLDENVKATIAYTDFIDRGTVAIILYNSFYADMNEKTTKSEWVYNTTDGKKLADDLSNLPENLTKEQIKGKMKTVEIAESIATKIYGIKIIKRRVVATPNYAIDLSALADRVADSRGYIAYAPTADDKETEEYVVLAPVIEGEEYVTYEDEKADIAFKDLGFEGKADDYFLKDVTLYINKDGKVVASDVAGEYFDSIASITVATREKEDEDRDWYWSSYKDDATSKKKIKEDSKGIRTGHVKMGNDTAYFWNLPENVENTAWSLYPVADEDGRMTYKAGYTWYNEAQPEIDEVTVSFTKDRFTYMDKQRANHDTLTKVFSNTSDGSAKYNVEYYDCNNDGVIDYFWLQPYTWGKVVVKSSNTLSTNAKHTGDSANRAVYNSSTTFPEIYVGGDNLVVKGGAYQDGQFVYAYVSGPANFVRIAPDELNASVKYMKSSVTWLLRESGNDKNTSRWANGTQINAWNSGNHIVGHVNYSASAKAPTGLVGMSGDKTAGEQYGSGWRGSLEIGDTWELYVAGGRVLWARMADDKASADVAKSYAIVDIVDVDENIVVFEAGGIEMDGTLHHEPHVRAFIGGKYQYVPLATTVDGVAQDNDYFLDNNIANEVSTYTVSANGKYSFRPYDFSDANVNAKPEKLDTDDASAEYVVSAQNISFKKFKDNLYQFVPAEGFGDSVDASLKPNGMKCVAVTEDTLIIVKYVNEDDEDDYLIYTGGNMPNFDASSSDMRFTDSYIVIKNNPNSTTTENLSFLYCVIGGGIIEDTNKDNKVVMVIGNQEMANEDDEIEIIYSTYDITTGEYLGDRLAYRETASVLADFTIYELTEDGEILNTTAGKVASLANGSGDLTTVEGYEAEEKFLMLADDEFVVLDENTTITLLDRSEGKITVIDDSVLALNAEDDEENDYFDEDATKLSVLVLSTEENENDIDIAAHIIVVKD